MKKSLTWSQLDENNWLLICVGYINELPFSAERAIMTKGIIMNPTGVVSSTSTYTWRTYTMYKKDGITEEDKLYVETIFNNGDIV